MFHVESGQPCSVLPVLSTWFHLPRSRFNLDSLPNSETMMEMRSPSTSRRYLRAIGRMLCAAMCIGAIPMTSFSQCTLEGSVATYSECQENGSVGYFEFVEWSGGTPPYSGYVESSYLSGSFSNEYGNGWQYQGELEEEGPFQVLLYLSITDAEGCEFEFSTSEVHNWLFAYDRFILSSTVWDEQSGTATVTLVDNPGRIGDLTGSNTLEYEVYSEPGTGPPTVTVGMISDLYVPGPPRLIVPDLAPGTHYFSIGKFLAGGVEQYPENICTGVALTITISAPEPEQVELQISALLGGVSTTGGLMDDHLREPGLLPMSEPFTDLGYSFVGEHGSMSVPPTVYGVEGPSAVVDWVLVELRDATDPATVLASTPALLSRNGSVMATDGVSPVSFQVPPAEYSVSLRHRNHLGVMTAAPLALSTTPTAIDFTNPSTPTYGTNAQRNVNGTMVLWPGDGNGNGVVRYTGTLNDRDPILQSIGGIIPTNSLQGVYDVRDINMDGMIRYTGTGNDRDIILQTIGGTVPTAVRVEQTP